RPGAELERDRKPGGDDVGDPRWTSDRRAEVAVHQRVEVLEVLRAERPVEVVGALDVLLHLGAELALAVEGPAGRGVEREEGEGRDAEGDDDGREQPSQDQLSQRFLHAGSIQVERSDW